MSDSRAGVLLKIDGVLHFVAANEAVAIDHTPRVERVPGAPQEVAGIMAYRGEIIPVISLSSAPTKSMLIVRHANELVGLVGTEIVATGISPGEEAPALDIAAIHARLRSAAWAGRWGA